MPTLIGTRHSLRSSRNDMTTNACEHQPPDGLEVARGWLLACCAAQVHTIQVSRPFLRTASIRYARCLTTESSSKVPSAEGALSRILGALSLFLSLCLSLRRRPLCTLSQSCSCDRSGKQAQAESISDAAGSVPID